MARASGPRHRMFQSSAAAKAGRMQGARTQGGDGFSWSNKRRKRSVPGRAGTAGAPARDPGTLGLPLEDPRRPSARVKAEEEASPRQSGPGEFGPMELF